MNGVSPEMLMSVYERQQARMKLQQQQSFVNENENDHFSALLQDIKPVPCMQNGWPDLSNDQFSSLMVDEKIKKRTTHEDHKLEVGCKQNDVKEKKVKGCSQEEATKTSSKSNVGEPKKQDFIHVRARRGQATDSHSLAERVRREKISERMKYLQELVPGCSKITGKAGMLDEIINYVQSLQKQVEFLSMKLASLHPRFDSDIDNLITKEMFELSAVGYSSEIASSAYFQLNSLLEMGNSPIDMMLRRSMGAPVSIPETSAVPSCYNQIQPSVTWDGDLQILDKMGFQPTIPFQAHKFTDFSNGFSGAYEGSNLKMEM